MVMDGIGKISISLAFSKLVLDDVKVEILLISWHFLHLKLSQKTNFLAHFEMFLVYAFLRLTSYTPVFYQIKHLVEVHNFISVAFAVFKLYISKCFCDGAASMKWPLLGAFWALSPQNIARVC